MELMLEELHFAKGIDPVADAFTGTVYSDIYNMKEHDKLVFLIYAGVGATGTSTITVEGCDDVTPSNTSAAVFWYSEITTGDTPGTITKATTAGFTTTAGSSRMVAVEVHRADLPQGYPFVRVKAVEVVDNPVLGGICAIAGGSRYKPATTSILS